MFLFAFRLRAIVPASTCVANVAKCVCVCVCGCDCNFDGDGLSLIQFFATVGLSKRLSFPLGSTTSDQIVKVGQQYCCIGVIQIFSDIKTDVFQWKQLKQLENLLFFLISIYRSFAKQARRNTRTHTRSASYSSLT